MKRAMRYVWIVLSFVIFVGGIQTEPVLAHEKRIFPPYIIFVGFKNEPAFEDEGNALDLFIMIDKDGNGQCDQPVPSTETCLDWVPVSTRGGDQVAIEAKVLYLITDAFNAQVRYAKNLIDNLRQDFSDPSRYNSHFKPNVGGAYGFILSGTVQYKGSHQSFPGFGPVLTLSGDHGKWVCGGGSQSTEERFGCVRDILQPFPFGSHSNYRDDSADRSHAGPERPQYIPRKSAKQ